MNFSVKIKESKKPRRIRWEDVEVGAGTVDEYGDVRVKITDDTYMIFCNSKRCTSFQVWDKRHWCGNISERHCTIKLNVEATPNA